MKKKLVAIIVCAFCAAFALCALAGCGGGGNGGGGGAKIPAQTMTNQDGNLFEITIKNTELTEGKYGEYLVVTFDIKNVSSKEQKLNNIQYMAYQGDSSNKINGAPLEDAQKEKSGKWDDTLDAGKSVSMTLNFYTKKMDKKAPVSLEFYGYTSATSHITFEIPALEK